MIRPSETTSPDKFTSTMSRQNVASIYPLQPNQLPWLWHSNPDTPDPGLLQIRFRLRGSLDRSVLSQAWQWLTDQHESLRMSIHVRENLDPMVISWRHVDAVLSFQDWQDLSPAEQQQKFQFMLEDDALKGLPLNTPPVHRLDVYQLDEQLHQVVWLCHHIFLDGWSSALLVNELASAYELLLRDETPPALPVPGDAYRNYRDWLKQLDPNRQRDFWRQKLTEFSDPETPLQFKRDLATPQPLDSYGTVGLSLDDSVSSNIEMLLANHQLTASCLCQGVLSLILSRLCQRDAVVFGTTVSGRSIPVEGMSHLIGMFSNSLPVFVRIDGELRMDEWLRQLRDASFQAFPHESTSPMDIESWRTRRATPLYETLLVIENFPEIGNGENVSLKIEQYNSSLSSVNPLTFCVIPGKPWNIQLRFDRDIISEEAAQQLCESFAGLLEAACARIDKPVRTIEETPGLRSLSSLMEVAPPQPEAVGPTGKPRELPASPVEERLLGIWQDILGTQQVGVTDEYFEIGGRSIGVIRMFAEIQDAFGKKFSPATLIKCPTIRDLARLISENATEDTAPILIPLRSSGDKPPLVCIHFGGSYAFYYRHLAKHLDYRRPVYGMQPPGLDGGQRLTSITDAASLYVDCLLEQFPRGPFHLLGYCAGGSVSAEVARQLLNRNIPVLSLTILDSGPAPLPSTPLFDKTKNGKFGAETGLEILRYGRRVALRRLLKTRLWTKDLYRSMLGDTATKHQHNLDLIERTCWQAFRQFQQKPVDMPILLVRSSNYIAMPEKNFHLRWGEYTTDLEIQTLDEEHESMLLEPGVAATAAVVESQLQD